MSKPSCFVGSSTEGLEFARSVRTLLAADSEVTLWNEGFFGLGSTFIETLVNSLKRFDFAILVLTPDDLVNSRATNVFGPRDNVIFELGLFMGHLGRSRTFILHQSGANLKIPTDLSGVTNATYNWPREDRNYEAAVGSACDSVRKAIRDLGVSEKRATEQIRDIQARQQTAEQRIGTAEQKIERLFANTMSDSMFKKLKKLATGHFGSFKVTERLRRELRHLRNIGYITVKSVSGLPAQGDELSLFVAVTTVGKEFVKFRTTLEDADASSTQRAPH